jgi:heme-degrading monooxygenase HmoA
MAVEGIFTINGGNLEQYENVRSKVLDPWPRGLLHHVCFGTDAGFVVIETWDSEEDLQEFIRSDKFQQAVKDAGMPQPSMQVHPVHRLMVPPS